MAYSILLGGFALSCLTTWSWWGGASGNSDRDYMRQTDGVLSECALIFVIY